MYKTVEYRVCVTVQTVDGCGNKVEPPTEGAIRRAIEPMADKNTLSTNPIPLGLG